MLAVALIVELTAVVLTLARTGPASSLWTDLARTSLFLLWIGFGCAAVLCVLRPRLGRFSLPVASSLALGAMVAVVALVTEVALWLTRSPWFGVQGGALSAPPEAWRFRIGNLGDRPDRRRAWRCAISTSPASGAATSSCRPRRACTRCRRASVRISSSTA